MNMRASRNPEAVQPSLGNALLSRPLLPITILVPALLFVYTLPHVIALRHAVMLALVILILWSLTNRPARFDVRDLKYPLLLIVVLQVWLVFVSVLIAPDVFASLREWVGQWLKAALVFVIGIGVGLILTREIPDRRREVVSAVWVLLPLVALALIHCVLAVKYYSPSVYTVEYFGPSDHRANITHVAALGLPFVLVDISERLFRGRRLLPGPWYVPAICIALLLGATLTSGTRNGVLVATVVVAGWALWSLRQLVASGRTKMALSLGVVSGCALVGAATFSFFTDPRWERFVETSEIAWQTEKHTGWYQLHEEPLPLLADGRAVDESAYLRVSYLKEGTKLLIANPWGTGISRHAFRNLLAAKYGKSNVAHSHMGLIDFGLSAGIPGIVIWVMFMASLAYVGWREYSRRGSAIGMVLLILVVTFFLRTLIDSTLREHILQQFLLVFGVLLAVTTPIQETSKHG
jgi:hypothetical protein